MVTIEDRLPGLALFGPLTSRQQLPLANPVGWVAIQALAVTGAWATTRWCGEIRCIELFSSDRQEVTNH